MPIKFIDLRDRIGRQSSIGLFDGKGASAAGVEIVGVLPHRTAFTFEEFDRFARAYLEARGYSVGERWADLDPDDIQGGNGVKS